MPMFPKTIDCPPFGKLEGEGLSSVWETKFDIPNIGKAFHVRIHGQKSGPSLEQRNAMAALLENTELIKIHAATELVEFLNACGVVPYATKLSCDNVWQYLTPCFVEVNPVGYPEIDQCSISIGYEISWEHSQLVHIQTINGKFDSIYSE